MRLDRVLRLRSRLRELGELQATRQTARRDALARDLAAAHAAEDAARSVASATTGHAIASAWTHADALAQQAAGLLDACRTATTEADAALETLRTKRRDEELLARLAERERTRDRRATEREGDRVLDVLALWMHGRKR